MDTGEWPARCLRPLQGDPRAAALVAHGKEVAQRGRPRTELTHTGRLAEIEREGPARTD